MKVCKIKNINIIINNNTKMFYITEWNIIYRTTSWNEKNKCLNYYQAFRSFFLPPIILNALFQPLPWWHEAARHFFSWYHSNSVPDSLNHISLVQKSRSLNLSHKKKSRQVTFGHLQLQSCWKTLYGTFSEKTDYFSAQNPTTKSCLVLVFLASRED